MQEIFVKLLSEFGVIATLFIMLVIGMVYFFIKAVKYFPKIIDKHFESIEKLAEDNNTAQKNSQLNFSKSLEAVTTENKIVTSGLLKQFEKQGADHEKLLSSLEIATKVLTKIDRTQDVIYIEIKDCTQKKPN